MAGSEKKDGGSGIDKTWLVKSGGRILGPFTAADVEAGILTREFMQVDEVCLPGRRWRYLKDLKQFETALAGVKNRRRVDSNITATASDSNAKEETLTGTMGVTPTFDGPAPKEVNTEATVTLERPKPVSPGGEIVVEDVREEIVARTDGEARGGGKGLRTFGTEQTLGSRVETSSLSRWLWNVALVVVIATIVGFFINTFVRGPKIRQERAQESLVAAEGLLKIGDYAGALRNYRSIYDVKGAAPEVSARLGILLIQLDEDPVLGRELLTAALAAGPSPEMRPRILNGIAISYLKDGELNQAVDFLNQAQRLKPDFPETAVNLGVASFRAGEWAKAEANFARALENPGIETSVQLMRAHMILKLAGQPGYPLSQATARALSIVDSVRALRFDFEQEAMLYRLYAHTLRNDEVSLQADLAKFLNLHSGVTPGFVRNLFLDREIVSWRHYLDWCRQIADRSGGGALARSLEALCLFKSRSPEKAIAMAETAVQMAPQNALVQSAYAYILGEEGRPSLATVARGKAIASNREGQYDLPHMLQAEFCEFNNDHACAIGEWTRVLNRVADHPMALAGLTRAYLARGDSRKAKDYFDQGVRAFADRYVPINKLYDDFATHYRSGNQ
jgi:tetratricopeptide (TPR) repeat protein